MFTMRKGTAYRRPNTGPARWLAHIALQREAIALGSFSRAMGADRTLVQAGDQTTALALARAYRPKPDPADSGLAPFYACRRVADRLGDSGYGNGPTAPPARAGWHTHESDQLAGLPTIRCPCTVIHSSSPA
jgi:hypothetical protein